MLPLLYIPYRVLENDQMLTFIRIKNIFFFHIACQQPGYNFNVVQLLSQFTNDSVMQKFSYVFIYSNMYNIRSFLIICN